MPSYTYRCEARNVDAFLSQLIRYISSGRYFYITGRIPDRKDPAAVDAKLIALYDIAKGLAGGCAVGDWLNLRNLRSRCAPLVSTIVRKCWI